MVHLDLIQVKPFLLEEKADSWSKILDFIISDMGVSQVIVEVVIMNENEFLEELDKTS